MMDLVLDADNTGSFKKDGVISMDQSCDVKIDSKWTYKFDGEIFANDEKVVDAVAILRTYSANSTGYLINEFTGSYPKAFKMATASTTFSSFAKISPSNL